ncbi:MAG: ARMT1-like domain-containing protein [Clostridia bacterium]|jgi:uncharacterized protein with ATP-grasp and redox domains|nr:ARMT1-like domain-containing protein [Clostridia bacterium]
MEIFLDCLPCVLRQTLEASRLATDDLDLQRKIMEDSIEIISHYKDYECSPDLCRTIHKMVKSRTENKDPYAHIKSRDIKSAKQLLPYLKNFLKEKENSLYWALKIAATGNIIDSAVNNNANMTEFVADELKKEFFVCDVKLLENKLSTAKNVLIIADNAGETVFDQILAERLLPRNITYAVRSNPILNDATVKDAYDSGLDDYAKIISTGCDAPGTILKDCTEEFLNIFKNADVVISKGQGNFETLSECGRPIFFLLKAKCPLISKRLEVALNEYVFMYK